MLGTKGYAKTLQLIRIAGAEFADEVIEHSFSIKEHDGGEREMVNFEFIYHGNEEKGPF